MKSWRKNEEGKYYCDGDCHSWGLGVCTCGLWHHFNAIEGGHDQIAWDNVKHRCHNDVMRFLLENRPEKVTECHHGTYLNDKCQKCNDEADKLLKEIFG